jgi:hypothetical protein
MFNRIDKVSILREKTSYFKRRISSDLGVRYEKHKKCLKKGLLGYKVLVLHPQ